VSLLDIHAGLQFQTVAPLLGLESTAKYTVNAKCPYCGAHAWTIYQDNRSLEEWHYCSQCKVSGSILAMAAEHLGLTESAALDYLAEKLNLNISAKDRSTFEKAQNFRLRFKLAWAEAQENMKYVKQEQHQYLQSLGWQRPSTMGLERFLEGPGQLYGLLSSEVANSHFRNLFGKTSHMMAVVPYFRTPTDIGAFACFPRHREVLVVANCLAHSVHNSGEIGFAGLPLVTQSQSQHIVITSMLSPMIMLQMHNFNSSRIPLPLLGTRFGLSNYREKQWSIFSGRNLILWERKPTANVLHQAMMTDASLTFLGPDSSRQQPEEVSGSRWWSWVHHQPATDGVSKLIRNARPYEQALKNWARVATPKEKTNLLQDAEQYSTHVYDFVYKTIQPGIKSNFGKRITVAIKARGDSVHGLGGHTVLIERKGKWYSRSGHVRLAGILRINYIVVRKDSREYVGTLTSGKKVANFRVPIKKANWTWLRNFALENQILLQSDVFVNQHRNHKTENFCPFDAACRFQPPEVVRGLEEVGWDGEGFQFRHAKLVQGTFRQIPEFTFAEDVPGPQQTQCRLTDDVCNSLARDNPEMEATWALAIAVAAQVTAIPVGLTTQGIWIEREQLDAGLSMLYHRMDIRRGDYKLWIHKWPRRLDDWTNIQRYDSTGFFVATGKTTKNTVRREVIVVDLSNLTLEPRLFSHSADKIVLNYLRHFTQLPQQQITDWKSHLQFTAQQFREVFHFASQERINAAIKRLDLR
jgi:hypothetical protein